MVDTALYVFTLGAIVLLAGAMVTVVGWRLDRLVEPVQGLRVDMTDFGARLTLHVETHHHGNAA